MRTWRFASQVLRLQLFIQAAGWKWAFPASICVLGSSLFFVDTQFLPHRIDALREQNTNARQQIFEARSKPSGDSTGTRLHELESLSLDDLDVLPAFQYMMASASENQLSVTEATYHRTSVSGTNIEEVSVRIPVKGRYPNIRTWIEKCLIRFPALSLDDISFRRTNSSAASVEANIEVSLRQRARRPLSEAKS